MKWKKTTVVQISLSIMNKQHIFFSRQEKRSVVDAIFIQHSCTNKRQIQATCTQRDLLQGNVIISEMSNRADTNDKFVHKPSGCQAFLLLQTGADDLITEKGWK